MADGLFHKAISQSGYTSSYSIEDAVNGIKKSFTIDAQIIATYALSTSAIKGVKCRVIPLQEDDIDEWQVEITPKLME